MKVVCAWCGRKIGEKEGPEDKISHGICPSCKKKLVDDSKKNAFLVPVTKEGNKTNNVSLLSEAIKESQQKSEV